MKIKLDENLPHSLIPLLVQLGHDVHSVSQEGLSGHADGEIWEAVQGEGRFFVTQDMDFSDVRRFILGTHHGILLLRLYEPNRRLIRNRILEVFQTQGANDWARCFVVASESKIRVRRPISH